MELVSSRIVRSDHDTNGSEAKRVDLDTERGHVLLLELAGQVTLDESGLMIIPVTLAIIFVAVDNQCVGTGIATMDRCPCVLR